MARINRFAVSALLVACLPACDDEQAPPVMHDDLSSRGQVIAAKPQAVASQAASKPTPSAAPPSGKPAGNRVLCDAKSQSSGKKLPDLEVSQRSAGLSDLPESIAVGDGEWVWINLWAAWCVPCKQEIPLLREWERRLGQAKTPLRLVFVSLDDDERQLSSFLREQPTSGVKSTYWLREGKQRSDWLQALGVAADTGLPGHFLVDPDGKVRCFINGAVEPGDFPQLEALVDG